MFTGIVEGQGVIVRLEPAGQLVELEIVEPILALEFSRMLQTRLADVDPGDSGSGLA